MGVMKDKKGKSFETRLKRLEDTTLTVIQLHRLLSGRLDELEGRLSPDLMPSTTESKEGGASG